MNREPGFDETLSTWLDEGADRAPERFVWAALEDVDRTAQRGAWRVTLEELFMHLKPAAPILGVAAMVVLAITAIQLTAGPNLGDATPRTFTAEDLPSIIVTADNAPEGVSIDLTKSGMAALTTPLYPGGDIPDAGFIDGLTTEISTEDGGYATWAVVFETEEDAREAFAFIANEHESADGWGLERSTPDPGLGDESRRYSGPMYDFEAAETIFWRENNLLLAAVGAVSWDADYLRSLAEGMDSRSD